MTFLALGSTGALADSRALPLFPNEDIRLVPESPFGSWHLSVPQTIFAPSDLPCHFRVNHGSFIASALQAGASCGFATGSNHTMAWELMPEVGYARSPKRIRFRPAVLFGLAGTFKLNAADNDISMFGSIHYKLAGKDRAAVEAEFAAPKYNPFYLQKWADVFESSYVVGWLHNFDRLRGDAWALRVSYKETLPLALRRAGTIQESAALEGKFLDVTARANSGGFLWGGGIGYAVVTFDAIRLGFALPSLYLGYQW